MGGTPHLSIGFPLRLRRLYYSQAAAAQTRAVDAPVAEAAAANAAACSTQLLLDHLRSNTLYRATNRNARAARRRQC